MDNIEEIQQINTWIINSPEPWLDKTDIGVELYDVLLGEHASDTIIQAWFRRK